MGVRRYLPLIAIAAAAVSLFASVVLWVDARSARSANVHNICMSRNDERAIHRQNLEDQIVQTQGLPEQIFEQFGITRRESVDALKARKAKLHPLAC